MIAIVNRGPHNSEDPMGERTYTLAVNGDVLFEFKHRRSDGLAVCLQKAANAAKGMDNALLDKILELHSERNKD